MARKGALVTITPVKYSHSGDDLPSTEINVMQLGDPQGAHAFVQRCSVHVDSRTKRKNKTADAFVDTVVLFNTFYGSWQGGRAKV